MFDYEGSRSEFLKMLAEMGEEPAFIARARAPQDALERLLADCASRRDEMLEWPRSHFSSLSFRISGDWSRLDRYVVGNNAGPLFENLAAELTIADPASSLFRTVRSLLQQFVESGRRFNEAWSRFLGDAGLDDVNGLRDDFNRMYPLEKECAFGADSRDRDFAPLPMLDLGYLVDRFPLLSLPSLRK